jgi:hypothetical protein
MSSTPSLHLPAQMLKKPTWPSLQYRGQGFELKYYLNKKKLINFLDHIEHSFDLCID